MEDRVVTLWKDTDGLGYRLVGYVMMRTGMAPLEHDIKLSEVDIAILFGMEFLGSLHVISEWPVRITFDHPTIIFTPAEETLESLARIRAEQSRVS